MPDIYDQTTNVSVYDESGNLINVAKDSTSVEIRDTIGQVPGHTVLSRLLDIWNKLVSLFDNGVARIKLWDGTYQANITSDNKLKVETYQGANQSSSVIIKDATDSYWAKVDATGRLLVSSQTVTPPDTTAVTITQYSTVSGTVDYFYVIPNGETIRLTKFNASGETETTSGNCVELYYAPNGTTVGIEIIDAIFTSGNAFQHDLDIQFIGNGTRAILLRRRRLSGASKEIFGRWEGYY